MSLSRLFCVPACLVLVIALGAFGQFETASVLGTIRDPTGAVIRGSNVTLSNTKTGISVSTETDGAGNYTFLNVRIGSYRVKAESPGFKTAVAEDFTVAVSERSIDNYFNTANVGLSTDPRFPFGNAGRNIARGYAFHQADMGCTRISCWRARAAAWSAGPNFSTC